MPVLSKIKTDKHASDVISPRAQRSLDETDQMPPKLRQCVHDYGYAVVNQFRMAGVTNPAMIHQIMHEVWNGPRQPKQAANSVLSKMDALIMQAGEHISAAALVRFLWTNGLAIVPKEPSTHMVAASMAALDNDAWVSKERKHQLRLRAAIKAAAHRWWPHLAQS